MGDRPGPGVTRPTKYGLPVLCRECGADCTEAFRGVDRVVIRCGMCGARQFAFYIDVARQTQMPPPREDLFIVRHVERALLAEVSPPAQALYDFIRRCTEVRGCTPTLREIQREFGWKSLNSVYHFLGQLEEVGLIEREYGATRGIRLLHTA